MSFVGCMEFKTVQSVVYNGNRRTPRFLLVRKPYRYTAAETWRNHSGTQRVGENEVQALERELSEELGITEMSLRPLLGYKTVSRLDGEDKVNYVSIYGIKLISPGNHIPERPPVRLNRKELADYTWETILRTFSMLSSRYEKLAIQTFCRLERLDISVLFNPFENQRKSYHYGRYY